MLDTCKPAPVQAAVPTVAERIIELPGVEPSATPPTLRPSQEFLFRAVGHPRRVHHLSRTQTVPSAYRLDCVSQWIRAAHTAFADHHALTVSPEIIWYALAHDVAIYVKQNAQTCAQYFTASPDRKPEIQVRDDSLVYGSEDNDWARPLSLFQAPLREHIAPEIVDLFLPKLSTMTAEDETAILVAFMDAVSTYYRFSVASLCGIPRIRLRGSADDWQTIRGRLDALAPMFPGLEAYFSDAAGVLDEIVATVRDGDVTEEFWRSVYKYNQASGGSRVNGWITAFSAYIPSPTGFQLRESFDWRRMATRDYGGLKMDQFPAHVSRVPFTWRYRDMEISMAFVAGILGVELDGFVTPRLGFGVLETLPQ